MRRANTNCKIMKKRANFMIASSYANLKELAKCRRKAAAVFYHSKIQHVPETKVSYFSLVNRDICHTIR